MKTDELTANLKELKDLRRQWGDILVIGLCTIVCGGEDFTDMESFGPEREEWLRGFLLLPNGIPDSDAFRRIFERVSPARQRGFP